ncbi:maternal effect embryo arrest 14 [Striga hermonthica]|uniref:Maternal effect embryo arrest 14 n=1 Tax=Striga hermonthica TaxID=68872 RepID=A0A9N7NCT6_STRHE|nr:maternal effect embryo arrest 14 [Striga hermonthica]
MIRAAPPLNSSAFSYTQCSKSSSSRTASWASTVCGSFSRKNAYIPKLEPFDRSKFDIALNQRPLIEKTGNEITDYCLKLEGDECYDCWMAYFELQDLEKEMPKDDVERLIIRAIEAGGMKTLISYIHGVSAIYKRAKKEGNNPGNRVKIDTVSQVKIESTEQRRCPIPDGLPKTEEEIKEEEEAKMPDSPFTILLRAKGRYPAWYTPRPDHETD